ncbi:hypothetical protein R3P38DRAFT_2857940 [Favolaschia claudopus]|uniref:Uncharacterized protein n=1 Tax=Favolaschia claudopus TaxID=2862362 RepID=A0AAW0DKG5_9AGAR
MTLAGGKPPTSNLLVGNERTRMIRSTRKLGAVMGTTPLLVDREAPVLAHEPSAASMSIVLPPLVETPSRASHRSSKREGVIFTTSRSSTSSLNTLEKVADEPLPSVAKLSLSRETRNSLHSVTRLRLVLTLTQPLAPSNADSDSPPTCPYASTDSVNTLQRSLSILISSPPPTSPDLAARRKKMVKLVNMLGGPIPASVVFPPPKSKHAQPHQRHSRRRSRSVPPTSYKSSSSRASSPTRPRKLVRPRPSEEGNAPTLSVDLISHPRPLIAYSPARTSSSSPTSNNGTVSSTASRGRPVTPSYGLRRRGRESTQGSEP